MQPYVFQRGETITLALDALEGDPASVQAISAQMKAVLPGRTSVTPGEPVAADFTISPRAAAGSVPAGWTLVIPAAQSAGLTAGSYLADARLVLGDAVVLSDPVSIRIRQAVTA